MRIDFRTVAGPTKAMSGFSGILKRRVDSPAVSSGRFFFKIAITSMPTEYITAAWQQLTTAGWTLKRAEHDLVEVTNPGGYTSTMRVRRLPSLARYVH